MHSAVSCTIQFSQLNIRDLPWLPEWMLWSHVDLSQRDCWRKRKNNQRFWFSRAHVPCLSKSYCKQHPLGKWLSQKKKSMWCLKRSPIWYCGRESWKWHWKHNPWEKKKKDTKLLIHYDCYQRQINLIDEDFLEWKEVSGKRRKNDNYMFVTLFMIESVFSKN